MKSLRHKKLFVFVLSIIVLGVSVNSYSGTLNLKYSTMAARGNLNAKFPEFFAEAVEKRTNGTVKVKIYYGGVLSGQDLQAIQSGIADFVTIQVGSVGTIVPWATIGDALFLIEPGEHFNKVFDSRSEFITATNEKLAKHNLRIPGAYNLGTRHITSNKPIYTPSDLTGLKIRVIPIKHFIKMWEIMGARPTPVPVQELSQALLTKIVDAQENPITHIRDYSLFEVQKYANLTAHLSTAACPLMNNKAWEAMDEKQKESFMDAQNEAAIRAAEFLSEETDKVRKLAESKGMTFIGPKEGLKVDEFRKKAQEIYSYYKSDWGVWLEKIDKMR